MGEDDDGLVRIGIENEDGEIKVKAMEPVIARQLGKVMIALADEREGVEPRHVALRRRWKPGGERDMANYIVGWSVGMGFFWANSDWTGHWWIFGGQIALGAIIGGARVWRDAADEAEERRERYHGPSVDETTGRLPWQ
ncbi:membrane protein [Gordonia phage Pleakley]|uniref:Uncharacterized protein n=1 Tax=Gordonia phage Pleakley TaxID=2283246 RepID=A0A345M6D5_9CAUD|nr:membrane protein [Gordonia phage Pleakley]AXH49743.1 hypothetical protein SEA_FURY_17 [Gordonia phage Fury]AXH66056.1 hypothetical protein SEA_PLEAKLEY_17 [Gordonia phage Pleakley]